MFLFFCCNTSLKTNKDRACAPFWLKRLGVTTPLKAVDTIGDTQNNYYHKTLLGKESWGEVDGIKHCEKQLLLK